MSVGLGADAGLLAVSLAVYLVINPAIGCHYCPPGRRLLSQRKIVAGPSAVPSYTVRLVTEAHGM